MKTLHTIYTNFAKRLAIISTLLLTLGVTSVWGAEAQWEKVTSALTDWSGEYILVYNNQAYDGSLTSGFDNSGNYQEVSDEDGIITLDDKYSVTIKAVSDGYSVQTAAGYFIGRESSSSNGMDAATTYNSTKHKITITYNTTSYTAKLAGSGGRVLGNNSGRWRFFSSTNTYVNITLYKKAASTCSYTVTFNGNGNTGGSMDNQTFTCDVEQKLTANSFSRTGYTFTEWNTLADGTGTSYTDQQSVSNTNNDNITLYAQWQINSYKVTWKPNGGNWSGNASDKVEDYNYGATITTPTNPTRYGYNFTGWNPTPATTMPASDQIYTAQWTEKSLTNYRTTCSNKPSVSFDLNDGSGSFNPETLDGDSYTIPKTEPTRNGYNFAGWKINGEGDLYQPEETINNITESITLVAQWSAIEYTITYHLNGGSGVENSTYTIEYEDITLPTPTPEQQGLNFVGWYANADFTGLAVTKISRGSTGDKEFWAKWEKSTPTFAWSATTCTAALEADNPFPTLNNPNTLPVTYTSSNQDVATIDVNTGEITLKATGTTTITATGAETATHKSATATYELTVLESNCRWVEVTDNTTLEDGDELVVMMAHGTYLYALPYDEETANNSNPAATSITLDDFEGSIVDELIWFITKDNEGNNFTLSPKTATDKYLTCNASNNAVRVNTGANRNFTIENDFLKNTAFSTYLAISTAATPKDWRHFESANKTISSKAQTLKFYKRECLDASKVWVEGNLTNVTCSPQLPQQLAKDGSITLTFTAADDYALPNDVTVTNATKTWNQTTGELTISNPTDNVMVTVEAVELHTITWMVGGSELTTGSQTTSVENGKQITAIPAKPNDNTLEDCGATKFMGWSTDNIGSTPDADAPTDLFTTVAEAQSKIGGITENKTFHAVFATASGISDVFSRVTELSQLEDGNTLAIVAEQSDGQIFGTGSDHKGGAAPVESDGKITISVSTNKWILEKVDGGWKLLKDENNKLCADLGYTAYGNTLTIEDSQTDEYFFIRSSTKYLEYYKDTWQFFNISGTPSSTQNTYVRLKIYKSNVSYSNYVTSCCETPAPTNGTFDNVTGSGNAMSLTLNWEGSASRYHITGGNLAAEGVYTPETSYTVNSLTECEEYIFNITAYPEDGCESEAIIITAQPFSGAKTVNYNYNGGSGSPASFTTSCDDDKREIILPVATRPGYTFEGWYDSEENKVGVAGATYDPATSPITLYAHWTENTYQLQHSGSNYTNTENKTSIKSSETPFTLHYTCTGDYGLPAIISITGGGKSWTVGTDYTWEVTADKQSATLVIKETVISADVTITINVATRYTVTFVHNDKGVFSGSETIEVLSSENTITLPTVTDVSCGFYDTFEGWIVADEDYTESTSKPAGTIYKGGANYTVNSDCTLRALYSKCEGDATQVYAKVTTIDEVTDGTYILVSNNTTPRTYSGHTNTNNYGNCIDGLSPDGNYYSKTLPIGAVTLTVTRGTGDNASRFTIQNGTKYFKAGSDIALQDAVSWWQLTTGEQVNSKNCPAGALQPVNATTYVMQEYQSNRFKTYQNTQPYYVFLYKLIDKCTKYYSTNPSCEKPVGVHIVYNANAVDASMSCTEQNRTYKVENEVNKYPQLASQLQFCTNATREGYTLAGWNTQANGQGTTYNINQNYYRLPVSGDLDGDNWITLNLYAVWKQSVKFDLGNATGGTGVPDAIVENGECVLPEPTAEQLGTIPCAYEFYAWSETSVTATQSKPTVWMPGDTYTGSATTLYAVYRLCESGGGSNFFSLSYIISGTKYYVGPVLDSRENHSTKFRAITNENEATVFGMKSIEGKTYKSLFWVDGEGNNKYMYWKDNSASFQFTSEEDDSYGWNVTGTTALTFVSTQYMDKGARYLSADATEIGCPSDPKAVTQFTKEAASTQVCTYATNPTCYTTANLHFMTNGGTLNYPTSYDETNYQDLTAGSTVLLPTATFAGEWTFEGWKRGSQLESQTLKPNDPSFYPVTLNTTQFEVDALGDIYFYAVYSKTNDDKQFDPVNGGTYKLFAIGADDTKTYMPIWDGGRGTMSGVTECYLAGDYTITPGTGTYAGQYQITCGEYTLGVQSDADTDLKEDEGIWWNIEQSTSEKGTWRITIVGSSNRALSALSNSFGNYSLTQINNAGQTQYRDMEIGECIYTEYTSTPENTPYITITGAPIKITSANGERVYASTTVHIEAHNFTGERIIHLSATNGFGVDPVQVRTNGQGAYSGNVKVYYEPTTDGDGQTITTSVLTASQTGGTNAEKISQTFAAIQGRNMPANFVIAAKWDGHWYALPANCTSSLSSTEGLLIEVNDMDNPTIATAAPASAKYGLREVIPSRQTDYGKGVVFTERFAEGDKQFALYNGSNANIQVDAQYSNYAASNPEKYEWIPSTSDFKDYTLTNASTGRNLGLTSGTFGAYTAASNQVRLLPATFYEPASVQVLKWKANSVIVMYTGAEATATTQVGDNAQSAEQTLAGQKLTHGIYELTTNQALTSNAGGTLSLYFGASTRVELEIPLIISGEVTASANAHDVVILENSKLTAATTKYSYKDVYVYGGGKLAIPDGTQLGVNNIILRAGGISTNGAGQEATYQYIYPQVELKGTLTSSVQNIRYEYVTDYDHWYHLVLPFDGSLASIHYPTEYYGDQVKLNNTGSWIIKRYDGATRATGNYNAWKDIEEDEPKSTTVTAGKGYIYWGAPKKITANDVYDRPTWGIQRITMSVSAPDAKTAENENKTIAGLGSYENVPNNSDKDNDQGWNLIGNPYMVNLNTMSEVGLKAGKLVEEKVDGKWTGKWINNGDNLRYLTIPSEHFDTYEAKTVSEAISANALVPGRAFFVQLEGEANGITFAADNRASLMPALLAENSDKPVDIETGIILSNETLQDEMNFWIKDGKTNDYEYNADYPKTPNNNRFNIYGVHTNGDLSWVAISPELATESMPIGYQVPAAGTYTLSLSETYYSEDLESLYVTDHEMSPEVTVDLINAPYEFSVNQAETNNERFTISLKLKSENQGPTTGWENIDVGKDHPTKFIHQDRLYILRDGVIYDATGQEIQTINK